MRPHASRTAARRTLETSALLALALLLACGGGDDPVEPAPVASVVLDPTTLQLLVGQSAPLTATARDNAGVTLAGRTIAWTTSNAAVATAASNGTVTGVSAGSATITATVEGKTATAAVVVVAPQAPALTFASVTAGGAHTCALTAAGAAWCWGRGESGQLGIPAPTITCPTDSGPIACSTTPVAVGGGLTFARLAAGVAHTCGLVADGTAYCWGSDVAGQLGDGQTTNRTAPTPVSTTLKFVALAAGAQHTCGLTSDGVASCWGRNDRGQLGDGTTNLRTVPTAVLTQERFRSIGAGGSSIGQTCALTTNGAAWCWGDGERGQLGNGTRDIVAHPLPVEVSGSLTLSAISVGHGRHVCALTSAGAAFCWGENAFGGLGNGTMFNLSMVPTPVSSSTVFTQIVAGGFIGHSCALTSAGAAWCWGDNEVGAIGDGTNDDRETPAAVTGGLVFRAITAGLRHSCGITVAGAVYCWGSNGAGQLGTNSTTSRSAPTRVVSGSS
jgi:hypothetical protein